MFTTFPGPFILVTDVFSGNGYLNSATHSLTYFRNKLKKNRSLVYARGPEKLLFVPHLQSLVIVRV